MQTYVVRFAIAGFLLAGGCAVAQPTALITPDGKRGFGLSGWIQSESSEAQARSKIQTAFNEACGGPAKIITLKLQPETNVIGIPQFKYDGVAACD